MHNFKDIIIWIGNKLNHFGPLLNPQRRWTTLDTVNDIIIINDISTQEHQSACNELRNSLKTVCPKATIYQVSFYDKKSQNANNLISADNIEYITVDTLSPLYKINNKMLLKLLNKEYDLAIILPNEQKLLKYLAGHITAPVRLSDSSTNNNTNLIISSNNLRPQETSKEIIKYLKMLFNKQH